MRPNTAIMSENLTMKIQNLELLLRIKSLIIKAKDEKGLFQDIFKEITKLTAYEIAWVILLDENGEPKDYINTYGVDSKEFRGLCWRNTLASPSLQIYKRNAKQCQNCPYKSNAGSSLISKRLEFEGEIYGVFSVSVETMLVDEDVKTQFEGLVDDISFAIRSMRLKAQKNKSESELIESQSIYKKLLETSSILMAIMDLEGRLLFATHSLKNILGFDSDDQSIEGSEIKGIDFIVEHERARGMATIKEVLEKDIIKTNDYIFVRNDGKHFHMRTSTSLMRNASGEPIGFMSVFNDLSTSSKTDEALQISEEQFRLTFMKAPHGISLLDPSGVILNCNEKDAEMIQLSREEMIGKHVKEFLTDEFRKEFNEYFKQFIKTGVTDITVNLIRKDGKEITVSRSVSALNDIDGSLRGIIVHSRDITQEIESQYKINMLTSAIEQSSSVFTITDVDGKITYVNKKFEEVTGWKKHEVLGHNPNILRSGVLPDTVYEEMWNRLKKGRIWKGELSNKRKDGTHYWEYASMSSIRNEKGEITNMLKVAEDISERKATEQKLKEISERYRNIFNTAPNPIVIHINGKIVDVNRAAMLFAGAKSRKELLGKEIMNFVHETSRKNILNQIRVLNRGAKIMPFDSIFVTLKGERRDVRTSSNIISFGGEQAYMVFFEDITVRKQTELRLKEATERYHNIFELSPTPIVIHKKGFIVDFNKAAFEFSKYKTKKDLIGKPVIQFVHKNSHDRVLKRLKKLQDGGKMVPPVEEQFVNSLGELRTVITLSKEVEFKGEQAFMVVFEDITKRKESEQKLIESEKRFRNFFNLIPDPVVITDLKNGAFIEANKAALELTKMTREKALGETVFSYGLYNNIADREQLMKKISKQGYILNEEMELNLLGKRLTVLVSGRIIEPVSEQNMLFLAHDITERKKMESDLVKAKERAEAGEKLKSSFLSNMSHEVRTPMNAILGFSDLLRDPEMDAAQRDQYINIIQKRGTDLLKMISDIMDISKIESNSLDILHRAVRIHSLIVEIIDSTRKKLEEYPSKKIELITECHIDNDLLVSGDKYRIRQVINNLMDNAIKFTQEGSVIFRCRQEGAHVLFEIEDTGCGIAEDKIGMIFEHFVQVHEIRDISIGGAGLGLSISKSLLNLMHGDIWVESELDKGSTFKFSLPVFDGLENKAEEKEVIPDIMYNWSGKTILVAEDEPSNQMFIKVILNKTKARILMASDGEEAMQIFNSLQKEIDLVLVDVKMPKMNGYQLTKNIKEQKPDLPVIALTANAMNNDRDEALRNGCDDYLAKPIAKELLYSTIERYL